MVQESPTVFDRRRRVGLHRSRYEARPRARQERSWNALIWNESPQYRICDVREETLSGQVSATAAFTRCNLSSYQSSVLHDFPVMQMFGVVTTQTMGLSREASLRSSPLLLGLRPVCVCCRLRSHVTLVSNKQSVTGSSLCSPFRSFVL